MEPHLAFGLGYQDLINRLEQAIDDGTVYMNRLENLALFCYSKSCVFDRAWDDITVLARGLILDIEKQKIVATPFPKFFNYGERADQTIPDLPFETFEKVDGSLIIIFHHDGKWKTSTKGSLTSDQAKWAAGWLTERDLSCLVPGCTYLAEAIYPENRIVVHYKEETLVFLGGYDERGFEIKLEILRDISSALGTRTANRYRYSSISELLALVPELPANEEGFVIRFSNGLRLKIKGDEYRRIHALISRITPLAMWEALYADMDLLEIRKQLPEEFWADFDEIIGILNNQVKILVEQATFQAEKVKDWTDKEVGLNLHNFPDRIRSFIFPYRKNNGNLLEGKARDHLFRSIRPTGNVLLGYTPSYAMNRVLDDEG